MISLCYMLNWPSVFLKISLTRADSPKHGLMWLPLTSISATGPLQKMHWHDHAAIWLWELPRI